jgi:Tat protein secretion system quality control protein TatD with DNase activity
MAKKIAEIKREEEDVIAGQILENTKRFFIDFS